MSVRALLAVIFLLVVGCASKQQSGVQNTSGTSSSRGSDSIPALVEYSAAQLESFLDSVGRQDPGPWISASAFFADSIFNSPVPMDKKLSAEEFHALKEACLTGELNIAIAKRIFDITDSATLTQDFVPITFHSFDKTKHTFNEFAVSPESLLSCYGCKIYFFSQDKIISRHTIYNHYGIELKHFRDARGKTVVYYSTNFERGSGIWWFNHFFYQYDGDSLPPVLNELDEANLQFPWSARAFVLKTSILASNPLTIKIKYSVDLADSSGYEGQSVVHDSTVVTYRWDATNSSFKGNYPSHLTHAHMLSYYLVDNEKLFMHVHYQRLKQMLAGKSERRAVLNYLNIIKNNEHGR